MTACRSDREQHRVGAALFFTHTVDRPDLARKLVRLSHPRKLPVVLSRDEVARLLNAITCLKHQAALSVAYGAGLRVAEVSALKVADVDSERMLLRVERGKGGRYRNAMLSPDLLALLRQWWKIGRQQGVMHRDCWLCPGQHAMKPISTRQLHRIVVEAAQAADIASGWGRTRSATASPPTFWKTAPTSASSRCEAACKVAPPRRGYRRPRLTPSLFRSATIRSEFRADGEGMKSVDSIARVRRAFYVQGWSLKRISRQLHLSRNTIRKILRSNETEFTYERGRQPMPKIGPWQDQLDALLGGNHGKSGRERLTLIRIYEELRALGYEGGYDALRRYAKGWVRARFSGGGSLCAAAVPAGRGLSVRLEHEIVLIDGVTVTVKVAHVRLCHSRMMFVRAYPRETQEMVFDAHDRAFAFLGGACTRGIYDNMKTAVETVFVGKDRQYNRRFLQMCSHYLVQPVACTPASGWEKGQVENQVGLVPSASSRRGCASRPMPS